MYSPCLLAACKPPHREITEEAFPMLLCRNTCRANCTVYIAAMMIGRDKAPLHLNELLPILNIGYSCALNSAAHTDTHTDLHYCQSKTFPDQKCPTGENTDKQQSCVCSQTTTSPRNKTGIYWNTYRQNLC